MLLGAVISAGISKDIAEERQLWLVYHQNNAELDVSEIETVCLDIGILDGKFGKLNPDLYVSLSENVMEHLEFVHGEEVHSLGHTPEQKWYDAQILVRNKIYIKKRLSMAILL